MNKQTIAALEYISNLHERISKIQEKIKSLENDIERKDLLMTKALSYIKSPDMVDKILDELNREK